MVACLRRIRPEERAPARGSLHPGERIFRYSGRGAGGRSGRRALSRTVAFKDVEGRKTTLIQRRFVHIGRMRLAGLETTVIPENWSGRLQVLSSLDGTVINSGVERSKKLDGKHLSFIRSECLDDETVFLLVETDRSNIRVAEAARTRVFAEDEAREVGAPAVRQHPSAAACERGHRLQCLAVR